MQNGGILAEESLAPFSPFYCTAVSGKMLKNAILVITELVFSKPPVSECYFCLLITMVAGGDPLDFCGCPVYSIALIKGAT